MSSKPIEYDPRMVCKKCKTVFDFDNRPVPVRATTAAGIEIWCEKCAYEGEKKWRK